MSVPTEFHSTLCRTYHTLCISVRRPITEVKAEWNVTADVWEIEILYHLFYPRAVYQQSHTMLRPFESMILWIWAIPSHEKQEGNEKFKMINIFPVGFEQVTFRSRPLGHADRDEDLCLSLTWSWCINKINMGQYMYQIHYGSMCIRTYSQTKSVYIIYYWLQNFAWTHQTTIKMLTAYASLTVWLEPATFRSRIWLGPSLTNM